MRNHLIPRHFTLWVIGSFWLLVGCNRGANAGLDPAPDPTVPAPVRLELTPKSASVGPGEVVHFHAQLIKSDSSRSDAAVEFHTSAGTIDSSGSLTAGTVAGTFTVVATYRGTGTEEWTDTARIEVEPPPAPVLQVIDLSPDSTLLVPRQSIQLTVTGRYSDGTIQPVAATFTATGGTVDSSGRYTAGTATGRFWVRAESGTLVDSSLIVVQSSAPPAGTGLVAVEIAPKVVSVPQGNAVQFTATGRNADGTISTVAVTFTATGGSISSGGRFTAGSVPGIYQVIATHAEPLLADTARVTVQAPPAPTLQSIILSPDTVTLAPGAAQQFSVTGHYSDGSSGPVAVSYTAAGGSITSAGRFTAGSTAGVYQVIATTTGTTVRADTSHVTIASSPPPSGSGLGVNADLAPRRLFPADNPWNQPVDTAQVDPNSDAIIANIGASKSFHPDFGANWNGGPFGIPYVVVAGDMPKVPVRFDYDDESDPGPYPIPPNAPIEGGASSTGDRHVLIVDRDHWKLYELFAAYPQSDGSWTAGSGAVFDLNSNALRPAGWTSADAAGLPILPGLVRYDEVAAGEITHAVRFTVSRSRKAYIAPARHWASSDVSALRPPMGMRVRLKASVDISSYPAQAQVILRALKKYGMIVADNGSDWYVSGTADARWNDTEINTLKRLKGSDFEVVKMGTVVTP